MGSFSASLKVVGDTKGLPATVELQEGRLSIKAGEAEIGDWPLDDVGLERVPTGYKLAAEGEQLILEMSDDERFTAELEELTTKPKMPRLFSKKKSQREPEPEIEEVRVEQVVSKPSPPVEKPASRIPASVMGASPSTDRARPTEPERSAATTEKPAKQDGRSFSTRLVAMLDHTIDVTEKRWGALLPNWVFNRIVFVAGLVLLILAFVFRGVTSVVLLVTGVLALMVGGAAYTDDVMASKLLPGRATPTHLLLVGIALLGVGIGFGFLA